MAKKLRIAQFATSHYPFPMPQTVEQLCASLPVAYDIAKKLTKSGNEVIFFGPHGSKSKDFKAVALKIKPFHDNQSYFDLNSNLRDRVSGYYAQYFIGQIIKEHQNKPFDLIHSHKVDRVLPLANLFPDISFVYTMHDPIPSWWSEMYSLFYTPNQYLITISNAQRKTAPDLPYYATIYNGINLKLFPFSRKSQNYLLFAGRILATKGTSEAVEVAHITNKELLMIGPIEDQEYWRKEIETFLSQNIQHLGFISHEKLKSHYQQAKVFLMPIMWEEPFGLVVPEANACGTPVVAFARGSMPELIKDGYNGFLVKPGDVKAMAKAVQRIYDMPEEDYQKMRLNCRKHVEENFTIEKMAENYEKVYYKIVNEKLKKK